MKNKPEKRFRASPVIASIFAEGSVVNGEMVKKYSVGIDRVYKKDNKWQYTKSFRPEDLPKVAFLAKKSSRYIKRRSTK